MHINKGTKSECGLTLLVVAIIVLAIVIGCSRTEPEVALRLAVLNNCVYDVNGFILDKLQQNRIVMLADFEHGSALPRRSVTEFLNFWLDRIEQRDGSDSVPRKLFLVLEADSEKIGQIKQYAITEDPLELMRSGDLRFAVSSPNLTVESIEYYHDICEFQNRVSRYNEVVAHQSSLEKYADSKSSADYRISFEIIGPESTINISNWSKSERDSFFIWRRDEYSARRVIELLDQNPEYSALVFYGAAHLAKQAVNKNTYESKSRPGISGQGYYIAHYLTEHFGEDNVYTIGQTWSNQLNPHCYLAPEKNYAIDNSILDGIDIEAIPGKRLLAGVDGGIVYFEQAVRPTPVTSVWSSNLVDVMIPSLDELTNVENDFVREIHNTIYRYMECFAEVILPEEERNGFDSSVVRRRVERFSRWYESTSLDCVEDILASGPANRNIARMEVTGNLACEYYIRMAMVQYTPEVDASASNVQQVEEYRRYLRANEKSIIVSSLVNLLWVGNESERSRARIALEQLTSTKFDTAKEWTIWWRKNQPKMVEPIE